MLDRSLQAKFVKLGVVLGLCLLFGASAPKSPWAHLLDQLNQPDFDPEFDPSTHKMSEDLLQINREEMAVLEKKWADYAKKMGLKAERSREQRNLFFHEHVAKANAVVMEALSKASEDRLKINGEYQTIAKRVLEQVENNPVTKIESLRQYRDGLQIGFCFGRALMIHYHLLKNGVKQQDIAKIFSIGDLKLGPEIWRFHVAVLVRDLKHGFIVLDPLAQGIKPYKQWVEEVLNLGIKAPQSRVRLYVTDPRKFLPAFGRYDLAQIQHQHLKDYFEKIGKSLLEK